MTEKAADIFIASLTHQEKLALAALLDLRAKEATCAITSVSVSKELITILQHLKGETPMNRTKEKRPGTAGECVDKAH